MIDTFFRLLFEFLNADKGLPMRALNVTELDYVSGGEGDDNDNDNAGGNDAPPRQGGSGGGNPVYPPFIPTEPWEDDDGHINQPP